MSNHDVLVIIAIMTIVPSIGFALSVISSGSSRKVSKRPPNRIPGKRKR